MTVGIDFYLAKDWEDILDHNASDFKITVEADMCNAITNKAYWGPRYFLDKVIKKRQVKVQIIAGSCERAQRSQLKISHSLN